MTAVARLAAVFYGARLPSARSALRTADWEKIFAAAEDDFPIQLIRAFISHVFAKLSQSKVEVKSIVILADEVAGAEEQIAAGVTSILRKAVLDESILRELQATVVISSLLGAMPSGRHPVILELPERLDAEKVAKSWWKSEDAKFAAAALSDLPRLLEFGAEFLDHLPDDATLNQSDVSKLFVHVRQRLPQRYTLQLPPAADLYPAVFGEEMKRDATVMIYIKRSLFVNALQEVELPSPDGTSAPSITPVVSLFMISAAAKASRNPSSFAKLVAEFPENIELKEEGQVAPEQKQRIRFPESLGKLASRSPKRLASRVSEKRSLGYPCGCF
ncbi:unnamed protein product [Symbiodinium necroappetens]|uniref:Uncharacterized protein n=1 Tax=Symbiodinium necroappetens TaxID=1628268 RepID=A0A812XA49_9DINO|nr:unnamed protein product [Symbiodinium necroappetens]